MVQETPKHQLSPLPPHWHHNNRSLSSLSATSEAATFHSAHAHPPASTTNMEMLSLSPASTATPPPEPRQESPKPTSTKMARQDSGYAEGQHSRRTSTSSTRTSKPRRRTTTSSSGRASMHRGTSQTYIRTTRPMPQARHSAPPYQFYQFPSLPPTSPPRTSEPESEAPTLPPPPPATVQYWTSDSTRRLEYAAIDAASKGVRGFMIRLVPDCILPPGSRSSRRVLFHDGEEDDDAGSVRRYRLVLPPEEEEKGCAEVSEKERRPSLLRRWMIFGKRS